MSLDTVRSVLRSDARTILVEAPAGCGKTFEAAALALDLSVNLTKGQEVLLLAHTNAAVHEFRSRVRRAGPPIRAMTIDAFALELVAPYAGPLGLPTPLKVGPPDGLGFDVLAPKIGELLLRAPSIAVALARHYPVVIFDEHQDARQDQHAIATQLRLAGAGRVRLFGDPFQSILDGHSGTPLVEWGQLEREADGRTALTEPRRWDEAPELGAWILDVRATLKEGNPVRLDRAPAAVECTVVPDLREPRGPSVRRPVPQVVRPLGRALDRAAGTVAVLTRTNAHAFGIRSASGRRLKINEGADLSDVERAVGAAVGCAGRPRDMALVALDLFQRTCTGLTQATRDVVERGLREEGVLCRGRRRVAPILSKLAALYVAPSLRNWCIVIRSVSRDPPDWLRVELPGVLGTISRLADCEDPLGALEGVLRLRRETCGLPGRCASTIHKAKGREFDTVILPFCGRRTFTDDMGGRKLLYVALSRATRRISLLLPEHDPTPLLVARR